MPARVRHWFTAFGKESHKPHLLRPHGFGVLTLAVALIHLVILSSTQIPVLRNVLGYQSNITSEQIFSAINYAREQKGIPALEMSDDLTAAAQTKAQDMIEKGYWAHFSPEGREPWNFITDQGYLYSVAGENLARNFGNTPQMVDAWKKSPSHNANLMSTQYSQTGIAVVQGEMEGSPTTLVVQLFASPQQTTTRVAGKEEIPTESALSMKDATPVDPQTVDIQTGAGALSQNAKNLFGIQTPLRTTKGEAVRILLSPLDLYRVALFPLIAGLAALVLHDFRKSLQRKNTGIGSRHGAHLVLLFSVAVTLLFIESGTLL